MHNEQSIALLSILKEIIEGDAAPDIKVNRIVDLVNATPADICDLVTEKIKTDNDCLKNLRKIYSTYILNMEFLEKEIILR